MGMSCVPWEGGHLLCVQVASVSQARPSGGMWWAMCSKSVKSQCCPLQPGAAVMDGGGVSYGKLAAVFVAWFSQEWWLANLSGLPSVSSPNPGLVTECASHPYPGHWVQSQCILTVPSGILTVWLCSSLLRGAPVLTWFCPSLGWASQGILGYEIQAASLAPSQLFSLPISPVFFYLPTFSCFNTRISQMCLLSRKSFVEL